MEALEDNADEQRRKEEEEEQSTITSSKLTITDDFMLAEYKNISTAHFELHTAFRQMFRFYLGIVAVPVTVFAFAYRDATVSLETLPKVFAYILLLTSIIGLLMFLSLVNIRFDIIFYTRTVNGTRNYFMSRAGSGLAKFLLLPGDMRYPTYKETYKAYWWQFLMIAIINSIYLVIASLRLSGRWCVAIPLGILFFCLHALAYYKLADRRDGKDQKRLQEIGLENVR